MVYNYFASKALLLIPLLMLVIGALAGPCMPCQASNRRDTPWDHRLTARGVYNPKITSPNHDTVWKPASDVVVTWCALFRRTLGFKSLIPLRLSIDSKGSARFR